MEIVSQKFAIYGLVDPRNGDVRYVGMSKNPYQRYGQHLSLSSDNPEKDAWIRELAEEGLLPELVIFEWLEGTPRQAQEREGHWIQYHLDNDAQLFNVNLPKNVVSDVVYHKCVDVVFSVRGLTNIQFRILLHIARNADKSRREGCSLTIDVLAEGAECSERYARETLRELEDKCLIVARSKTGGRGKTTIYDITLPRELIEKYKRTHAKKNLPIVGVETSRITQSFLHQFTGEDDGLT